jgi:hypothetical protein
MPVHRAWITLGEPAPLKPPANPTRLAPISPTPLETEASLVISPGVRRRSGSMSSADVLACHAVKMRSDGHEVELSNGDKVFFPRIGLTKGDLLRYYLELAPSVLHHVRGRPMLMKRYPKGAESEFFYQKWVPERHPEWLETVHIRFPSGRTADFPVVSHAAALAWIVNLLY